MRFVVYGVPHGKARQRHNRFTSYNPKANVEYERRVRQAYLDECGGHSEPCVGPMWLSIECFYPIPKSAPKKRRQMMEDGKLLPVVRPDVDNVAKSVLDALNGAAYMDDRQVVMLHLTKHYDATPRVVVDIGRQYT